MKTRNLMTIFTMAFVVSVGTAFFVPSAEAGSFPKFSGPAYQVRERVERHDGDRGRSYTYERWERQRAPSPRENRWQWEHRERHYEPPRYGHYDGGHRSCDNVSHRHWGRHWHDDHGHAHLFFGWGLVLPGLYIGF